MFGIDVSIVAFGVGLLVGMTGVGGGAPGLLIGNLLGDFLKKPLDGRCSDAIQRCRLTPC